VNVGFVAPRLARIAERGGRCLFVVAFSERRPLAGITGLLDWRLHGHLSRLAIRGFLSGARGEAVLMPLGDRLPIAHLVILGAGPRDALTADLARETVRRMFNAADALGGGPLIAALPGRPEGIAEPAEAISLFLEAYDEDGGERPVAIVDSSAAQKAMLPVLERFRLKHWVPVMTNE
jgi:hypothetical protein